MISPNRARPVARGVVSFIVRHLHVVFLLFALLLGQGARAEAVFTGVAVTPGSGLVDAATGKLNVTVSGRVKAVGIADAIRSLTLYYDNQSSQSRNYTVRYTTAERPINDERSFSFVVPVDPGTHTIQLGAFPDLADVGYTPVYTVAATGLTNGAQVSAHAPLPATVTAGQSYNVSVTMVNTGTTTWTTSGDKPYSLGSVGDNGIWNVGRVGIAGSVAPGAAYKFDFTVTAPAQPGTYNYRWQMVQDKVEWFGAATDAPLTVTVVAATAPPAAAIAGPADGAVFSGSRGGSVPVTVIGSGAAASGAAITSLDVLDNGVVVHTVNASSVNQALWMSAGATHAIQIRANDNMGKSTLSAARNITVLVNDAGYVSSQNVPGTMAPGTTASVSVTMKNTGTSTWTAGSQFFLGAQKPQDNTTWRTSNRVTLPAAVPPGGQQTFSFDIKAPAANGSYGFQWQMVQEFVGWFGAMSPDTTITVATQAPTLTFAGPADGATFVAAGATAAVPVTGTAKAAGTATISKIELLDNDVVVPAATAAGGAINASVALAPGPHSLRLRATDSLNQTATSVARAVTVIAATTGNAARFVSQNVPSTMRAGQPYTLTVTMQNTGTTTWTAGAGYRFGAQNPQDNHTWVVNGRAYLSAPAATGEMAVFTIPVTAPSPAATYNFQWKMVQENIMWFGETSTNLAIAVGSGPGPTATLSAASANVRVSGTQTAPVTFSARGVASSGTITKLELFQGGETSGFSTVAAQTFTGSAATLSWNPAVNLPAGVYFFKLRATDAAGVATESAPVMVNITNSALLGVVSGVATRVDKNYLLGWTCQSGTAAPLNYQLFLDAPTFAAGATLLESGVANVATEANNAAVQTQCATPGAAHNFTIDLSPYTQYAGRQLFVRAADAAGTTAITLPCADNSCTVPGALRVGISTPASGAIFYLPNPAFLRMVVAGATKPLDEVGFLVNGSWVAAKAETDAPGAYSVSTSLAASATPYTVQAKIRQGNITLLSAPSQFTVSGAAAGTVTITNPAGAKTVVAGTAVPLGASVNGTPASVKFFANGTQIGVATSSGGSWNASWTAASAGIYNVVARSYDAAGAQLGASAPVTVTVTAFPASSATPLTVAAAPPHLGNADAGTLPGDLDVGDSGNAVYSMPLAVPPGTNGMEPKLSLNYASDAANGMVGLGWSLGGLSTIHRCAKTIAQDGEPGRISFDNADRLCLDGQRLLRADGGNPGSDINAIDAAYWAAGAQYRTEIESFSRVSRLSGGGFKVETKDGRIHYYGIDANSAIGAQGRTDGQPLLWALRRTEDRVGNYFEVDYMQDAGTGEYLPNQVRYGGNAGANQATDLAVRFGYEGRGDAQVMYMGGSRNDMRNRLTHIATYVGTGADGSGGTLVRDHTIHYVESATSGRSLVDWMQACATNPVSGVLECLPKTGFDWGTAAAPALTTLPIAPFSLPVPYWAGGYGSASGDPKPELLMPAQYQGDLDGSGRTSFIANRVQSRFAPCCTLPPNTLQIRLPGGQEFQHTLNTQAAGFGAANVNLRQLLLGDLDGDGRDDIVISANAPDGLSIRWGYCINTPQAGGTIDFVCQPGPSLNNGGVGQMVDLRNERKMHVVSYFDNADAAIDCSLVNGAMQCVPLQRVGKGALFTGQSAIRLDSETIGVDLSRHGMSDFLTTWTFFVPAADPAHSYSWSGPKDLSLGVATCFNRRSVLNCETTYQKTIPGDQVEVYDFVKTRGANVPIVTAGRAVGDLNGDGLTDFVYSVRTRDLVSGDTYVCLSKETGMDCRLVAPLDFIGSSYFPAAGLTADFIGDGVTRVIANTKGKISTSLCRYAQAGLACDTLAISTGGLPSPVFLDDSGIPAFLTGRYNPTPNTTENKLTDVFTPVTFAAAPALDRLTGVTNGLGQREEVDYARGNDAAVYRRFATIDGVERRPVYPQVATAPGVMVKQLRSSTGQGKWLRSDYYYEGAMAHAQGRGPLGFAKVQVSDLQSGIKTTTIRSQSYPTIGMVLRSQKVSRAGVVLNDTVNSPNQQLLTQPSGAQTVFPFISRSVVARKDLNGSDLGTTTTDNQYTDAWGNLTQQDISVVGGGQTFTTRTVTGYRNDAAAWLLGLPTSVTTTKSAPGYADVQRSVTYDYDSVSGLLKTETVEPLNPVYRVVTSYDRSGNSFGLVNVKSQTWRDPDPATPVDVTRNVSRIGYDAKGRFAITAANALGHSETYTYDAGTGARRSLISANLLTTKWDVDGFGRVTVERRADGNEIRQYRKRCQSDCPDWAVMAGITDTFHQNVAGGVATVEGRITVPTVVYSDSAGHVVRSRSVGYDGRTIVADRRYDDFGRVYETDRPRFDGATAFLEQRTFYDDLNRVVEVRTKNEAGAELSNTTDYRGTVVTSKNAKGQTRVETRDVLGRAWTVKDALSGTTTMTYDPFGNLGSTTDPNGNVIVVKYDLLGRKVELNDPDLGVITYGVDPVGRAWKQTSPKQRAKGEFTRMRYDLLDRMTIRYETDLESHWDFDTASVGKGQLAEAYTYLSGTSTKDYRRLHTYDALGRPSLTTQLVGGATYTARTDYDGWGRPITQTYQRNSDAAKAFDSRYNDRGYLARIERGGLVLWRVDTQDAAFRLRQVTLGNGLVQSKEYSDYTGLQSSGQVSTAAAALRVQEGYEYDDLGNVSKRNQYWDTAGFKEGFGYDDLNRLTSSVVEGQPVQSFTYDAAGNLTSKTGLGVYTYPAQGAKAVKPHGVSVIGGGAFVYDDNGNLTSGSSRSQTWTSFDMPAQITRGAARSNFVYGPEHQRTLQLRAGAATIAYAGAQEAETAADGTVTVKTYWPQGLGLEIDGPNLTTTLYWTHTDRLGSPIAISNDQGGLSEKLAYDAWGKRRPIEGKPGGAVDNKGYTGHEMLDALELVHMNGRVFDPSTARFMSGDPFVQDPMNGQNYNRYSYVLNNPTNLTDPSGFQWGEPPAGNKNQEDPCWYSNCFQIKFENAPPATSGQNNAATRGQANKDGSNNTANNSQRTFSERMEYGKANNGDPVIRDIGHFEDSPRKYATADQMMSSWIDFNFVSSLLKDAGVSSGKAEGIGFVAMMVGNPKQILSSGAKKAVAYSVAFETQIAKAGLGTRSEHFKAANAALGKAVAEDPAFAKIINELGIVLPSNRGTSPANWTWHHVPDQPGVLQLVPTEQHTWGSAFQQLLHPGGKGGFYHWGADY